MRRVLVVTSGRADASPMKPVIAALKEVEVYEIDLESLNMGSCVTQTQFTIAAKRPDIMLVLGDRYEILAACLAATYERVPIAHIHGGEASFGSFDNQIRDAVTKLAHIHFVSHSWAAARLRDLGENRNIHVVGAPGLDNLVNMPPRTKGDYIVATYHPVTLGDDRFGEFLEALDSQDRPVVWTVPNRDPGRDAILERLQGRDVRTLTLERFIALCRGAACIVGNSSMGIIEAPYMGVPSINVGHRQACRKRGVSVFTCSEHEVPDFLEAVIAYEGPFTPLYGLPGASEKIAETLKTIDLDGILVKTWHF